ncbi:alpha/beta fold hydrolase [Undibacterium sp. Ji83W]|uniref:alpha/beta fold hydrolase n=1 Tax=Undibacterium sp. Ji83W TaxID=3413043 RepID=UPI003BF1B21D
MRHLLLKLVITLIFACALSSCGKKEVPVANIELDIPALQTPERVTVVFVHGVLGNATLSWQAASSPTWPQMLASDARLSKAAHVISLAYLSDPLGSASNIHELATNLGTRLHDRVFPGASKVVFIAHSMGGIIARHMLLQMSRDWPEDYAKVRGIFFLATPSGGSDAAKLASWMSSNPQFNDMSPIQFNTFLQSEEDSWATLLRKRLESAPFPKAYCAYETLPLGPITVVPRNKALIGCDETANPFTRDHVSLVKPQNNQDEVYEYVMARLLRLSSDDAAPLRVEASLEDSLGRPVNPDDSLASGEYYAIRLAASRPVWFYVFNEDGRMKVERYFPSTEGGNQTSPQIKLRIPQDPDHSFRLDEQTGLERLTILASPIARTDLMAFHDEVKSASQRAIKNWASVRGAVIVKDEKFQREIKSQKLDITTRPGEKLEQLVFRHVAAKSKAAE